MAKNRIKIDSKDSEGNLVTVYVTRPNVDENAKAQMVASRVFKEAVFEGAIARKKLEKFLVEQGLWSSEEQAKLDKIDEEIREKLIQLKKGGMKVQEARDLAIEIRIARLNRSMLVAERNDHDDKTADAISENAKFDYLASVCIKDEEGNPIFKDVNEYKSSEEPYVVEAAAKLASMLFGLDDKWEENLPENQFLKKFEFVDEDLRLVNKDGKHVTKDNKLIDNDFRYINEQGEYVDVDGNRIDTDGLPMVEFSPFLDDDGNPIIEAEAEEVEEETTS